MLVSPGPLLLVHAHPDDETITCGGLMALATAAGVPVTLVTGNRGEQGEVIPPGLQHLSGDALGRYREGELARACDALGVTDQRWLGGAGTWHDSGMVRVGEGIHAAAPVTISPDAFAAPGTADAQVEALVAVLREVSPGVVVTYDRDGGYGHPDHVRAHEVTMAAVTAVDPDAATITVVATAAPRDEVAAGLEALRRRGGLPWPVPPVEDLPTVPDATITTRVELAGARVAKLAALRAHATQIEVHDDGHEPPVFALSNGLAQPVLGVESFVHLRGPEGGLDALVGST
ncbi:N-acetyl-1-D-myo-inositol-2-amino-2-deoxy-alpha-D-glucopyranoside deacetylase [Actinomycetospora cinnamomea]|uniref:N-acetyl-1-D-myo-inositol-2-amino-2-deoxy-alpha-D-glucopyranoside deacetylase n=1 Tax=Actinomycetospora cinnamomea TaxID=663609 RepID=A0A2U1F8T5_9PSEU|nr:N-acetyl-1-D-myo-inositol-2-amino-2-deoxy-alpha-D-glucopyranoside deacetylase [Actinomycetospora cinnamomea]